LHVAPVDDEDDAAAELAEAGELTAAEELTAARFAATAAERRAAP
jgi:hypothetical protein